MPITNKVTEFSTKYSTVRYSSSTRNTQYEKVYRTYDEGQPKKRQKYLSHFSLEVTKMTGDNQQESFYKLYNLYSKRIEEAQRSINQETLPRLKGSQQKRHTSRVGGDGLETFSQGMGKLQYHTEKVRQLEKTHMNNEKQIRTRRRRNSNNSSTTSNSTDSGGAKQNLDARPKRRSILRTKKVDSQSQGLTEADKEKLKLKSTIQKLTIELELAKGKLRKSEKQLSEVITKYGLVRKPN